MDRILNNEQLRNRVVASIIITALLVERGFRKKSLSASGAFAATFVGIITVLSGYRNIAVLIVFFVSSSFFTKYKNEVKALIEDNYKEGARRNWIQVVANGGFATLLALSYLNNFGIDEFQLDYKTKPYATFLLVSIVGQYACVCGDTWASELGILSKSKPILVTTLKPVLPGVNGAVSLFGLTASFLGGFAIGLTFWITNIIFSIPMSTNIPQWPIILIGTFGGFGGSLIDSFLGATLQYSGFDEKKKKVVSYPGPNVKHLCGFNILDNHLVNLLSAILTSILCGYLSSFIF